jgi:hypothetical protein
LNTLGLTLMNQKIWQFCTGFVLVVLAACSSGAPPQTETPAPFTLEPSGKNLTLELGGISSFVVALKRSSDFKDVVNMTFDGLPDGITQRWSRDTENGDCTVLLSVDPETPTGEFTLTLKGEPAQVQTLSTRATAAIPVIGSTQTVTITVQPTPGGSGAQGFTLAFSPAILGALQGNTVSNIAIVTPVNGFNQDVTFSVANLPPNVSVVVDQGGPNNQFLPSKFQAFLRLTPGINSVPGDYIINVTAQSAGFSRTAPLVLQVGAQGSSTPDFSVFTDAVRTTLRQGSSAQLLLRFVRRNGFTLPISVEPQLSNFPGVTVTKLVGQDAALLSLTAADNASISNGLFVALPINANAGGISKSVFTLLLKPEAWRDNLDGQGGWDGVRTGDRCVQFQDSHLQVQCPRWARHELLAKWSSFDRWTEQRHRQVRSGTDPAFIECRHPFSFRGRVDSIWWCLQCARRGGCRTSSHHQNLQPWWDSNQHRCQTDRGSHRDQWHPAKLHESNR